MPDSDKHKEAKPDTMAIFSGVKKLIAAVVYAVISNILIY